MKNARFIVIFIIKVLLASHDLFTQEYYHINYNTDNGLPSSEVYHVYQDSKGYIWFCTDQGISRYDKYKFTNYDITDGLPSNTVFEAYEDYKGRIWFINLRNELFYWQNDKFYIYPYNDTLIKYKKRPVLLPSKGTFFVDSSDNIYYTCYKSSPLKIDSNGYAEWIYFSNDKNIIIKILKDNKTLNNYLKSIGSTYIEDYNGNLVQLQGNFPFFDYINIFAHSIVNGNNIIISTRNNLFVVNRKTGIYRKYEFEDLILWLSQDENGIVWIGILNSGIKGFKASNFDEPLFHFLKEQSVSSILEDKEGGHWVTTLANGVFYFPSLKIKIIVNSEKENAKSIRSICSKDNKIWFANNSSKIYSYGDRIKEWKWNLPDLGEIEKISWINDKLFVSFSSTGITGCIFDTKRMSYESLYLYFHNSFETSYGSTILGTSNKKYFEYFNDTITMKFIPDTIHSDILYDIYVDSLGAFWFGTEKGLILKKNEQFYYMSDSNDLYSKRITRIINHNQNLWLATKGGGLIQKTTDTLYNYTTDHGLPSNSITDIVVQKDTFWIGTNNGIAKFVDIPEKGRTEIWSTANGLISNEVNDLELLNEKVYVATQKGICVFNQAMSGVNKVPPPVYINKILINSKDTILQEEYYLHYTQNHIAISYIGLNFQRNSEVNYKFRIKETDNSWNYTAQTEAIYSSLIPGKYTFQVLAINNSGILSTAPAEVKFYIKSPYWQTRWFKILTQVFLTLIIIFIITGIFRLRMRNLKKQNLLKQEMNKHRQKALSAQMNPHFLYNSINSAQYFILHNQPNNASDYLSDLGKLMRIVLNNSIHDKISLHDELKALFLYIEMEQRRFQNSFILKKTIDETIDLKKTNIPPLIIQPYVENAIHHGLRPKKGEKLLSLSINKTNSSIILTIEDNGIGRKNSYSTNKLHVSLGTELTKRRLIMMEEIYSQKMTVNIEDLYDNEKRPVGTKVILTIKLVSL